MIWSQAWTACRLLTSRRQAHSSCLSPLTSSILSNLHHGIVPGRSPTPVSRQIIAHDAGSSALFQV